MSNKSELLQNFDRIRQAVRESDDGLRCAVAPAPELNERIKREIAEIRSSSTSVVGALMRVAEPSRPGLNDGLIIPVEDFPLGTPLSVIRNAAADRAPLRGVLRVIVVLVDFSDKQMTRTRESFHDLFFSIGALPTKSVREYYREVTHGLIDIQGEVVGPFRLPLTLAEYAHNKSGLGAASPNAQTMARDAVIESDPSVNFNPFDNDGNGFVDAFIIAHAGGGAEQTGNPGDIWSHKWVLEGGAMTVDSTRIFGYLTVPEDSKIGVCCHELGHLLFGFPDLYDTDQSSEGIGDWCLMAGGSWGGGGDTPAHPSAWCKANQGWVSIINVITNGPISIPDVKDSNTALRLWKDGGPGSEYFLVENRQKNRFDASLPSAGLLIWHIDDSINGNSNENHYKVALMQADGGKDLEHAHNRGDAGDPYPGASGNSGFHETSNPNSKAYNGVSTCVSVTGISAAGSVITANVAVRCRAPEKDRLREIKVLRDQKRFEKLPLDKRLEKPQMDKTVSFDKGFSEKFRDKLTDGKFIESKAVDGGFPGGLMPMEDSRIALLEARVAALEEASGIYMANSAAAEPFIGSELRPDLSQSALTDEEDYSQLQEMMRQGSSQAKRLYDSKLKDR